MLLVYKPDTRGRAAPEGGGLINRNILSEGDLQPVAMWLTSKRGVWLLVTLLAAGCGACGRLEDLGSLVKVICSLQHCC